MTHWPIQREWKLRLPDGSEKHVGTQDLAAQRILILKGPAGIGKTTELRSLLEADKELGREIRSLRMATHCSNNDSLLGRLEALVEGATSTTVISLDALDEALAFLPSAVLPLEEFIRGPLKQTGAILRIACRAAVWPPPLENAIRDAFGLGTPKDNSPAVPTADLQPLSDNDILAAAVAEGLDSNAFQNAIKKTGTKTLALHPVTLRLLVGEFGSSGRLPTSRAALFDRGAIRLVEERTERSDIGLRVDSAALIKSAANLACFMVLTSRGTVDLGDEPEPGALTRHELASAPMPVSQLELQALARTGLFDSDGDRAFSFTHRQFAEFLTGRQIGQTMPPHEAKKLLSTTLGPLSGVAGPLRETAAFAAHFSKDIANWLAQTDPEVLALSEIADDSLKRLATQKLLDAFRNHRLTDFQLHRDGFSLLGLQYANAHKDIRPILAERGPDLEDLLECAIEIVEQWGLTSLADDLATLMLDENAPAESRKSAGYALIKLERTHGVNEARKRLKPLLKRKGRSAPRELTGLALRALWPDYLSATELLQALPLRDDRFYVGALEGFAYSLDQSGFDASDCPLEGLKWALRHGKTSDQLYSDNPHQRIAKRIARRSLAAIGQPKVLNALADVVVALAHRGTSIFELGKDSAAGNEIPDPVMLTESNRRALLLAITSKDLKDTDFWMVLSEARELVALDDFPWLIDAITGLTLPLPQRTRLADCLRFIAWDTIPAYVELWLARREIEPLTTRIDVPLSCPLEPPERLKAIRDSYYRHKNPPEPKKTKKPVGSAKELVLTLLGKSEAEDPRWFIKLSRALTIKEGDNDDHFKRELTTTSGWLAASDTDQERIVDAAIRYLGVPTDRPEECRKESLNSIFMDGYIPAILLLQDKKPSWLADQPDSWWARWAWYIAREMHFDLHGEENEQKSRLFSSVVQKAWPSLLADVVNVVRQSGDDAKSLSTRLLRQLEDQTCAGLDQALVDAIDQHLVPKDRLREVAEFLIYREQSSNGFKGVSDRLLDLSKARVDSVDEATPLLVALLSQSLAERWEEVFAFLKTSAELAKSVLLSFLHSSRLRQRMRRNDPSQPSIPGEIGPDGVFHLIVLLIRYFPPEHDPKHEGSYWSSAPDSVRESRERLIGWLGDQKSHEAVTVLKKLEQLFGERYTWLRRPRSRAERLYRLNAWDPFPLATVAELMSAADRQLIRSSVDALEGVTEAIGQLQSKRLRGGNSVMQERLWNTSKRLLPTPKPEEHVSDEILEAIETYFERYATTADREVSLYRRVLSKKAGGLPGDEVDIFFRAPAKGTVAGSPIRVPIEAKLSHNPEARTALRNQLYQRYMQHANTDFGVFVLVYMSAPGRRKAVKPLWKTPDLARKYLQGQADEIRKETAGSVAIRVLVLDASIPMAPVPPKPSRRAKKGERAKSSRKTTKALSPAKRKKAKRNLLTPKQDAKSRHNHRGPR